MSSAILECADITKSFGGVPVLKGITLDLEPGSVTALAGENGAGKSTLMKIISGQYSADHGSVSVKGTHLAPGNPRDAVRHGVAIVPQELASIEDMTVYENLFVGRELRHGPFLDRSAMIAEARETLSAFDVDISPTARMGSLPVGLRQIVEIVKAARTGAQVVMLDEPTSAISEREVEGLYGIVRRLRDHGVAMVYTTHKMAEIRAIADRVVVLRDGGLILDKPLTEVTDDDIVTAMIGRELDALFPDRVAAARSEHRAGGPEPSGRRRLGAGLVLGQLGRDRRPRRPGRRGSNRTAGGHLRRQEDHVRRDPGAGPQRQAQRACGSDHRGHGDGARGPQDLRRRAVDERARQRLAAAAVVVQLAGWLRGKARTKAVSDVMSSVRLRSSGLGQQVGTLSGGNQQKVVLARWLTGDVNVLLLDEPTRGVDVGARSEIYRIITEFAEARHGRGDGVIGHARDHRAVASRVRHARRQRSSASSTATPSTIPPSRNPCSAWRPHSTDRSTSPPSHGRRAA